MVLIFFFFTSYCLFSLSSLLRDSYLLFLFGFSCPSGFLSCFQQCNWRKGDKWKTEVRKFYSFPKSLQCWQSSYFGKGWLGNSSAPNAYICALAHILLGICLGVNGKNIFIFNWHKLFTFLIEPCSNFFSHFGTCIVSEHNLLHPTGCKLTNLHYTWRNSQVFCPGPNPATSSFSCMPPHGSSHCQEIGSRKVVLSGAWIIKKSSTHLERNSCQKHTILFKTWICTFMSSMRVVISDTWVDH